MEWKTRKKQGAGPPTQLRLDSQEFYKKYIKNLSILSTYLHMIVIDFFSVVFVINIISFPPGLHMGKNCLDYSLDF